MKLTNFECSICLEDKQEQAPCLIDGVEICIECIKENILPSFENALKYEHDYPPKWGPIRLAIADFEDIVKKHFDQDFLDRYRRREIEYSAKERVYCKHQIDSHHAPQPGGVCPPDSKLALTPSMIETYKAAGRTQLECGGFVTEGPQPPGTIVQCSRCHGKICAACETVIHENADEIHLCNIEDRADDFQDPFAQMRGRDVQECPNGDCRNTIALGSGCNHLICNRCGTNFCFVCGAEADADSGHWNVGNPCPRYNQPGDENAHHDEVFDIGPELEFDDEEWGTVMSQMRFVAMYRLEDGVAMIEQEWLYQVLRTLYPDMANLELQNLAMRMFPAFSEVQVRPPQIPGWPITILSPVGLDEVAMRAAECLLDQDPQGLTRAWIEQLVRDLELRELPEQEYEVLHASLADTLLSVTTSYNQGLFDINVNNATPEVEDWARLNGFELDDESVVALLRLYDDISLNLELAELAAPDDDQIREFRERNDAILRATQRVEADLLDGTLVELADLFDDYSERLPDWA